MSSAAQETVCTAKKRSMKHDAASFPAVTTSSDNAVSCCPDFAPTSGEAQHRTCLGFVSACGQVGPHGFCSATVLNVEFHRVVSCRIASIDRAESCGLVLGWTTKVLPWYTCTTVQKIRETSSNACKGCFSVSQTVTRRCLSAGPHLAGLSILLLACLSLRNY